MQGSVSISGNQFRNFGQFADLPEKLQPALESGLSFFELRFQGEKRFNQNVFGFYDVVVERNTEMIRRNSVRYNIDWRTGRDAKITFECINQNTGLSIAFMVDDPFWHNRMMMAFNPTYMIFALHTREGQIPGSIVSAEIECLREICQEKSHQFAAINPLNRTLCADFDESIVDDFIKEKQKNSRRPVRIRKIKRVAYVTREEVTEIIRSNDRTQFGWTNSDAFNKKIKEPTMELIERRGISRTIESRQSVTQGQISEMVAQTLRSMSPEQIRAMISGKNNSAPAATIPAPVPAMTQMPPPAPEFKNKTFFLRMKHEDAKAMAKMRGLQGFETLNRKDLTTALISDEEMRKEQWEKNQKDLPMASPNSIETDNQENTGAEMIAG